jgi:hypothetical protein
MFRDKERKNRGAVDGGEGRGVPLGGHDERLPTGYRSEDDELENLGWDEEEDDDGRERRRDPLRKI